MTVPLVDLRLQYESIREEIDRAITEVIQSSAFISGPYARAFEQAFASFCGVDHCVGVGNGTDALTIVLKAFDVGQGDEVIVPANSFIATSEAVTQAGARVVFADICPMTYTLDVSDVKRKISERTKAIIPVHLYGHPAEMDDLQSMATAHGLYIVEDAAQAHGATYKERTIGSIGHAACFSFFPGKILGAYGDAGAILTSDESIATRARMIANHGRRDKYDHELEGVNSRLDSLQAAILTVKLKYLPEWIAQRREIAKIYSRHLDKAEIITPSERDDVKAVYHLYVIRVDPSRRQALRDCLSAKGIATGIHYPIALPRLKAYAHMRHVQDDFPEAVKASQEILSLPVFPELRVEQVEMISEEICRFLS